MARRRPRGSVKETSPGRFLIRVELPSEDAGKRDRFARRFKGTRKEAEAELTKLLRDLDTRALKKPTAETVETYLWRWLEASNQSLAPATQDMYKRFINARLAPAIGSIKLQRLSGLDIQACYAALAANGLGPATVRRVHGMLRSALEQARDWKIIPANPADDVKLPKVPKVEMAVMDEDQANRFLNTAACDRQSVLWTFMLETGVRPGEALSIRWSDLDLAVGKATVQPRIRR